MTEQPSHPYGQQQPYGQPQYGEQHYGQPQYSGQQPQYGWQPYGQEGGPAAYGRYDSGVRPGRRGGVTAAAVLGIVWGALGVLVTIGLIFIGAFFGGSVNDAENAIAGLGSYVGAAAGVLFALGLLAAAWAVVMIWGSVRALSGRSRVLLIVGASISIAATAIQFIGSLASLSDSGAGSVVVAVVLLAVSILIVVLLSNKAATQYFTASRTRLGR